MMHKLEVILDLKSGATFTMTCPVDDVMAAAMLNGAIDHIEVRVELPPDTPPMKSVFSVWKPKYDPGR